MEPSAGTGDLAIYSDNTGAKLVYLGALTRGQRETTSYSAACYRRAMPRQRFSTSGYPPGRRGSRPSSSSSAFTPAVLRCSRMAGGSSDRPSPATAASRLSRLARSGSPKPSSSAGLLRRESDADAIYDPRNRVAYLISNRLTGDLAPAKVLHEIGEHYGLETMLGERGWRALAAKVRLMAKVDGSRAQGVWSAIRESYSEFARLDNAALGQNKRFLHEVLAHLGETQAFRQNSVWRDLVTLLKRFLVKLGFTAGITEADVGALLEGSLKHAAREAGKGPPQPPRGGVSTKVSTAAAFASAEQTKTPAFKRWFGDWEIASLGRRMRDVRGSDQAKAAAREFLNKPLTNAETGIVATVSRESLGKMLSKSSVDASVSPQAHMMAIGNLDELFRVSILRGTRSDRDDDPKLSALHHFEVPMPFAGDVLRVKILAKEFGQKDYGTRLYVVQAVEITKPASIGGSLPQQSLTQVYVPPAGFEARFARMVDAVKGDGVSKVVDADGRPRVMYHATDAAGFSQFKRGRRDIGMHFGTQGQARDRFDIKLDADPYGPELRDVRHATMPVYLNIRNPLRMEDLGVWESWSLLDGLLRAGIKIDINTKKAILDKPGGYVRIMAIRDFIESLGYDGIVYQNRYEATGAQSLREARDKARDRLEEARRATDGGGSNLSELAALEHAEHAYEEHLKANAEDSYIAFHPEQIKSAVGNAGTFDPKSDDILRSQPAPVWYSELARQIDRAPMKRALAGAWMQYINALKGVKPDEIAWSGIEDFLKLLQPGKVTKEQVSEFLRGDGVQVEDVMLGETGLDEAGGLYVGSHGEEWAIYREEDDDPVGGTYQTEACAEAALAAMQDSLPTKFAEYQLPGGENYRELLLTLPDKATRLSDAIAAINDRMADADEDQYRALWEERQRLHEEWKNAGGAQFRSTHFDQPNILAHVRFNEREFVTYSAEDLAARDRRAEIDEKIKALDARVKEAQQARRRDESAKLDQIREEVRAEIAAGRMPEGGVARAVEDRFAALPKTALDASVKEALDERRALQDSRPPEPKGERKRVLFIEEIQSDAAQGKRSGNVNWQAPFIDKTEAWVGLALKRMIRYAAERGFDSIAWTTGEEQVERYRDALRKAVDRIEWTKTQDGIHLVGSKDGKQVVDTTEKENVISDAIGKSMGEAIINDPNQSGVIEGDDITISDTGMAAFYDRIVPNVAKDILKKLGGGAVSSIQIPQTGTKGGEPRYLYVNGRREENPHYHLKPLKQPAFDITPALRARAMQGMPMFSLRDALPQGMKVGTADDIKAMFNRQGTARALFLREVNEDEVRAAADSGLDLRGFSHTVDQSAINHIHSEHGKAATESGRGQLPVRDEDVARIPDIIDHPDAVRYGFKNAYGQDAIGYAKRMPDGAVLYFEEVRRKRRDLAAASMRRYPATSDIAQILSNAPLNARDDGGNQGSVPTGNDTGNDAPMASVPLNLPEYLSQPAARRSIRERIADAFNTQRSFNWWHKSLGTQYHKAKIERHFAPVYELAQRYLDDTSRFANEAADRAPDLLPKTESVADAFSGIANTARDAKDAQAIAGPIFEGTLRERVFSDAELRDPPLELGKPLFKPLTDRQIKLYRQYLSTVNHSLDTLAVSEMARLAKVSGLRVAPVDTGLDEAVSFYRDQYAGELEKVTLDIEELRKSQAAERKLLEEAAEDEASSADASTWRPRHLPERGSVDS